MDGNKARVRINLAQGEFEVEGSEAFIESYREHIEELFDRLKDSEEPQEIPTPSSTGGTLTPLTLVQKPETPSTPSGHIGEWLERMPRSATDVDRILAAGYFTQLRSNDHAFGTGEANALLTDQGIKVGNPSQCVKQNLVAKRLFRHQRRYRVSQTGIEHLRHLLGPIIDA